MNWDKVVQCFYILLNLGTILCVFFGDYEKAIFLTVTGIYLNQIIKK